ncbi:hypothetical protein [Streptomyces sp. DSM 41534]
MIEKRLVTNALASLLGAATALPVGRSAMPSSSPPYYVLTPVDVSTSGAPYADANEDMSLVYQVICVSGPAADRPGSTGTLEQAEGMADKARTAILGRNPVTGQWLHPLSVTDASVMCRELETEPGATSDPADGIISYVQRFRLDLTAA